MNISTDSMHWHHLSIEETFQQLDTSIDGLASSETIIRLARTGRNEIVRRKPISPWRLLVKQFANFFVIVLFAAVWLMRLVSCRMKAVVGVHTGIVALTVLLSFLKSTVRRRTGGARSVTGVQDGRQA
jgi:Ca2+-transporting ATPase